MEHVAERTDRIPQKCAITYIMMLFFLSGISGLIYEVVWTRLLTYVFGATIYAVTTVLASYMGGLALGSFIFGKLADRWERLSLKAYALLQLFIGISAILLIFFLELIEPFYGIVYDLLKDSFFMLSLVRFMVCFLALLVPTTLMGGTLPLLARFITRHQGTVGLRVGGLYAINTLGAVVGCFLAGFYFIALFGVRGTIYCAAFINVAVAILGLHLWQILKRHPRPEPERKSVENDTAPHLEPVYDYKVIKVVMWLYFFSGMFALAFQVGWWRGLVFSFDILKNTTYAFTAMLSVFLIGLALGSALMSRFADRQYDPLRLFGLLQILIGLAGFLSVFIIYFKSHAIEPFEPLDPQGLRLQWYPAVANLFVKTAAAIGLPTLLMGMAFPVVVKVCVPSLRKVGVSVGRLYALNTVGAIIGAFLAGFVLIPVFGLGKGLILLAVGYIMLGLVAFLINPLFGKAVKNVFATAVALIALVMIIRAPTGAVLQPLSPADTLLFYKEGPLSTVAVVQEALGTKTLYVDNVGVAGTDPIILTDQKSLAHVPMLLLPDARSALTVGFGSGGASWSYTRYDSLEKIHCVEISKTVIDAAPFLLESNHGILELNDPRFTIILEDVRSYLLFTDQVYDIIATDCTDLRYKTNANLYDKEYFQLCRERLSEDGMVVVWMPLAGLEDDDFRMTLRTFYTVFPDMSIWYMNNEPTHYILLLGTKKPFSIDYARMKKNLASQKVKSDLSELLLDDVDKILSCYLVGADKLNSFLGEGKINTENHPYLEFETPKYGYGEQPLIDNLKNLLAISSDVVRKIQGETITPDEKARLERFVSAVPDIIEGICAYRLMNLKAAAQHWMDAKEKCPEDRAVAAMLNFPTLRKRIEALPFERWTKFALGEVLIQQQRFSEAITWLRRFVNDTLAITPSALRPMDYAELRDAYTLLATAYESLGKKSEAREYRKKADELKDMTRGIPEEHSDTPM